MTERFFIIKCEPQSIESLPLVGRTPTRCDGALSIGGKTMKLADRKRLRYLTIACHWIGKPDWYCIYNEMRQSVRDNEFYQETRGTTDEYIAELRRLRDLAFDAAPKCERCDRLAGMLRYGYQRCSIHLTPTQARKALLARFS